MITYLKICFLVCFTAGIFTAYKEHKRYNDWPLTLIAFPSSFCIYGIFIAAVSLCAAGLYWVLFL